MIGTAIFLIGNIFYNDFRFNSPQQFLVNFGMYQLYAFVLGFSNMTFFSYMEGVNWKGNKILRIAVGFFGAAVITLIGLFFLRLLTAISINQTSFESFLRNETWKNY